MGDSILTDVLSGVSSIANVGANIWNTYSQNRANEQNLAFQRDTLSWEKEKQGQSWLREDNAVQRRVADMKKAGINPVLAAGAAASSSPPIHITTPQKTANSAPVIGNEAVSSILSAIQMKENIAQVRAQTDLINQQIRKQGLENILLDADVTAVTETGTTGHPSSFIKLAQDVSGMIGRGIKKIKNKITGGAVNDTLKKTK
nr:MAG: DNA pilot protein [Microvirus sp.]